MLRSTNLKKTMILIWLVTFLPFTCAGCDYSNLGALLDVISVVAACFPGWGTVIAAACQVIKVAAAAYGEQKAQDEYDDAKAEGRQPDYDDWTRALCGMGGLGDPGSEEDQSTTNSLATGVSQVVASGYNTYQNNKQNTFTGGQKSNSTWINPDTGQEYNTKTTTQTKSKLDTSNNQSSSSNGWTFDQNLGVWKADDLDTENYTQAPTWKPTNTKYNYNGWSYDQELKTWTADDLDIENNSSAPTWKAPEMSNGQISGLTSNSNRTYNYNGWTYDPTLQKWYGGKSSTTKPQWKPTTSGGKITGFEPLKQ